MRVAVAGGTGRAGSVVVRRLEELGHEPVVIARSHGVDVVTGAGLAEALRGADSVVDVTDRATLSRRKAFAFFTAATSRLLSEGARQGVRRYVVLSIVGVDRVPVAYYDAKVHQEGLVLGAQMSTCVLRATQFHEFSLQMLGRTRGPLALVPRQLVQPVAVAEVASALATLATDDTTGHVEIAGPQRHQLVDLARRVARARGIRRVVVGVRLPGPAGTAMATGALLPTGDGLRGTTTFDDWLRVAP